ncbi:MAG: rhodanese-like domain-containing protein [Gammaproteobacteria bacterium]|nr:rhodanese-like domain-containing protein [Gammaproteobacteria bacterium]
MTDNAVKGISPEAAYKLLQNNPSAVFIDVRSAMEFLFVGHPKEAINIPWIDEPDWCVDPKFAAHIRQVMLGGVSQHHKGDAPVVLICRSGKRSLEAGELLLSEGFADVYNVMEGFEGDMDENHHRSSVGGWRFHGLLWEQC